MTDDASIHAHVDAYIDDLYGSPDPGLAAAVRSLEEEGMPDIAVSPSQGRFLGLLVMLSGASRVLEIGTLAGYSAIWLARAMAGKGRLVTIESNPDYAKVARRNIDRAGLENVVEIRIGPALEVLPALEHEGQEPFDVVFIDADKERLPEYLESAIRLARSGTLIIADNVIRGGRVLDRDDDESVQAVRRFNHTLARHPALTSAILQTNGVKGQDGFAFALVK